ncbi:MAG: hypothetical protein AAGD22_04640 [Verrucomicrobiota bacterium]
MMSDEKPLELSELDLMPNWVTELDGKGAGVARGDGAGRKSDTESELPGRNKGDRRQGVGKGDRHGRRGRGDGGRQGQGAGVRDERRRDGGRRGDGRRVKGRSGGGRRDERGGDRRRGAGSDEEPLKGVTVAIVPDEKGVVALAKYVRETGRAYPLVDIAKAMLSSRDRYALRFEKGMPKLAKNVKAERRGKAKGANISRDENASESEKGATPLIRCLLDGSLWISKEEALGHAAKCDGLAAYYRVDEVEVEPPKGNYQVVAVHERTGTILGPPNHHEYQRNLLRLHQERFRHVPFDKFSRMMEMRRDEETLEKWRELKSKERRYTYIFGQKEEGDQGESAEKAEEGAGEEEAREDAYFSVDQAGGLEDEVGVVGGEGEHEGGSVESEAGEAKTCDDEAEGDAEDGLEEASEEATALSDAQSQDDDEAAEGGTIRREEREAVVFKTEEEMARHFASMHGDEVLEEVDRVVVRGDISGQNLSPQLLSLLRRTVDEQRKFPSGLIQELCRAVEKHGLKVFKEGKKRLHVSPARPRRLDPDANLTDTLESIVHFIREHPESKTVDLLEALIPGYERPRTDSGEWKPSKEELSVLKELHWLTSQGYVIEFSSSRLRLAGLGSGKPKANKKAGRVGGTLVGPSVDNIKDESAVKKDDAFEVPRDGYDDIARQRRSRRRRRKLRG